MWYPKTDSCQTRQAALFHLISPGKHQKVISKLIPKHREAIINTRKSVSKDNQTPLSSISKTRRSVLFDTQTMILVKHDKQHFFI